MKKEIPVNNKLIGMKQICNHLGVSESTALTWHRDCAMPLKKTKSNGQWLATRSGLDKWFLEFTGGEV